MKKSIHSTEYEAICRKLLEMRRLAGMTQQQLADALAREQSFVWRIENGERRLDLLEFFWVCRALGQDARAVYSELASAWGDGDGGGR
ncbi:MAG TPA: XRE family transcriptional regulator [Verrucomicrobia bacterium]|nr:XRE family transcriptional regulator [Verrucomicrobiota bacterium]